MLEVIASSIKTSATHMTSSTFNALPKMIMTPKESRLVFVYYKNINNGYIHVYLAIVQSQFIFSLESHARL